MQTWLHFSEVARNAALIAGGLVGLYLAWLRVTAANQQAEAQKRQSESAARQTDLQQRKLVTDLFAQAVAQLSDEKLELRLLGIYTLRQIVDDYEEYRPAVIALLSAYVRDKAAPWGDGQPPIDVREIFKILGGALEDQP